MGHVQHCYHSSAESARRRVCIAVSLVLSLPDLLIGPGDEATLEYPQWPVNIGAARAAEMETV